MLATAIFGAKCRTDVDLLDDYFVRMQELVEKSESVRRFVMLGRFRVWFGVWSLGFRL